jgi:phage terminase large subunit
MFRRTTAINKIRKMQARIKVVQGGTSAGKTFAIIPILIDRAAKEPRIKITVVAEALPAVKEGALDIFKNVMFDTGRWIEGHWNASALIYTFFNGSRIQFKSFDSAGKAKASGKRDILFLNEANHIPFEIADALMIRSKETYIDYNPDNEFWVHTEVLPQPNAEFLLLTYLDNEAIPAETLEDLMLKKEKAKHSKYWANWCKVYIDGQIGSLQGTIFNYTLGDFKEDDYVSIIGADQGWTHPSAFVKVNVDKKEMKIYAKELFYGTEKTASEIYQAIKDQCGYTRIFCDSAAPMFIKDLKVLGLNIRPCKKPKIKDSIIAIQNYELIIDKNSLNLIAELNKYRWTDKDKEEPIDEFNHAIDALRYAVTHAIARKEQIL